MADGNTRRMAIKLQSEDDSSYYVVPINPIKFEDIDNIDMSVGRTVDGYSFEMRTLFDGRPRTMLWKGLPNRDPYSTMVSTLKTYVGQTCNIKLNYLEGTGTQDTGAITVRVLDVQTQKQEGAGAMTSTSYMTYSSIKLMYVLTGG